MTDRSGALFETNVVKFIRELGLNAERLPKAGVKDEGDLWVPRRHTGYLFELKARRNKTNQLTLGTYMAEAVREAQAWADARDRMPPVPGVILKRAGKPIGDSFAIFRLIDLRDVGGF